MFQSIKNIYHLGIAILANLRYFFPGRKLTVIGITGTDGKTTTSSLIYHILRESGREVSLISTVSALIGGKSYDTGFHVTNPAPFALQKFLFRVGKSGKKRQKKYMVLEVTSHGIDQNRIWGIPFAIAGITNVTHEHLDYHKTYDNYLATKAKLLQKATVAVINRDDASFTKIKKHLGKKHAIITYGKGKADINPETVHFTQSLPGEYNLYNSLLAIAVCKQLGITDEEIRKAIKTFTPPAGRTEIVYKKDFTIMIDFAHTPNAFEQLLSTIRPQVQGRLIHVFGSAGLRDKTKRPLMGKTSANYADIIILTAEDPRSESITKINEQIKSGIRLKNQHSLNYPPLKSEDNQGKISAVENRREVTVMEIPDRQEAILKAVSLAHKGDYIILTGKAHEKSINYGKGEIPWSEHEAVKKALIVHG